MKKKQLKMGVILSYGNVILQNGISIIYTPMMLRILGQSEYGLYQLVYSVVSYLGLLNFGVGSTYIRFHSRSAVEALSESSDTDEIAILNGMYMVIFLVLTLVVFVAGGFLVGNVKHIFHNSLTADEMNKATGLMILMIVNLAITFPNSVFDSYITAHEQYFFQRMLTLSQTILNPFLTLPLLLMGYKSISLVVITTVLTVGKLLMNLWFCVKKYNMRFAFHGFQLCKLKELWMFSFYIFMNMIVDQINWSVDKFLLGKMIGTIPVAIYAIGGQINMYFMNFSTSISSVFIPRVNRFVAADEGNSNLTALFVKVGRIQFFVLSLILSGFILYGKYFINAWAGVGYNTAYTISLILIVPVMIPLIQNIGVEIQRAKNLHRFRSITYLVIAMLNIFISIPLIKLWGEIGAAMGTAFSIIIGNIVAMNLYYYYQVGLDMIYFWKQILSILPGLIFPMLIGILFRLLVGEIKLLTFACGLLMHCILFFSSVWFISMNDEEKRLLSSMLSFIKVKNLGGK